MGTFFLGPKCIPYTYIDPLGYRVKGFRSSGIVLHYGRMFFGGLWLYMDNIGFYRACVGYRHFQNNRNMPNNLGHTIGLVRGT